MRRLLPLTLLVAAAAAAQDVPPAAAPPEPPAPLDASILPALLSKARSLRLAEETGWLRLGRWRPRLLGGLESQADGPKFFRSPRGKTDPAAELEATLAALFDPRRGDDELDDATCRFPARRAWLADRLGLPRSALPQRACPRFDEFRERVKARSVTLVFSSYYLNNPASAFGHTFLRLNRSEQPREGKTYELLDYGVDYSATVDTGNAVLYAFKGLLGFFKGNFNHYPYYYKVREYADYESRDLWEFDLALAPDEVERLVHHLWELGGTWFDYWYLDENCSYHVLGALEAAAPRLKLVDWIDRPVVLPSDTVKALLRNPGLVARVHYRPSTRTQFLARAAPLSAEAKDAVEALVAEPLTTHLPGTEPEQAATLDAAADLLDLRYGKELVFGSNAFAAEARQQLLTRRAGLRVPSPPLDLPPPERLRPDSGHGSWRVGLAGGASRQAGGLLLLDARLCLHDLADPPHGYPDNAQVEFLQLRLRWAPRAGRLEVDDAAAVRVVSLNPVGRFDRRPSWRFRVGATTIRDAGCPGCAVAVVEGGAGFDLSTFGGALDTAAFADLAVEAAPGLAGLRAAGVRVGVGPGGLIRLRLGEVAALLATGGWHWLPEASPRETHDLGLQLRLHLARRVSLGLTARHTPTDQSAWATVYLFDGL